MGRLVLAGGNEFHGAMEAVDRRALRLAGGVGAPVGIVPAAAFPDGNHGRAGARARRWFQALGATDVRVLALTDQASAMDPQVLREMETRQLIYLLGGFPRHLGQCLVGTPAGSRLAERMASGAVVAGSSAGAMVLGARFFDPLTAGIYPGMGLAAGVCVLPHHNRWEAQWVPRLRAQLPDCLLLGIDEETGLIEEGPGDRWRVCGRGGVTRYGPAGNRTVPSGATLALRTREA